MKTIWWTLAVVGGMGGQLVPAAQTQADPRPDPGAGLAGVRASQQAAPAATATRRTAGKVREENVAGATNAPKLQVYAGPRDLRFNFRGVPLDTVLHYLSEAAGLTIVCQTQPRGTVDAWSEQPLNRAEAVELLNSVLNGQGYAALLRGRTLTVVSREEAKRRDLPVRMGADPKAIPRNDEMVTQILPIRHASATQLVKDLQGLLPAQAAITANESGNALVLTDTQANIRRFAEIIAALDSCISGASSLRVFPLKNADAKDLATVIKELYPAASNTGNRSAGVGNLPMMMMGGPSGMGNLPGGPGGGASVDGSSSEAKQNAARVAAVADERTNCLIVSGPEEVLATVAKLVEGLDNQAENVTAVHLFQLKNADPNETADLLASLFTSSTSSSGNTRTATQFGGRGGTMGGAGGMTGGRGGTGGGMMGGPGGGMAGLGGTMGGGAGGSDGSSSLRAQQQGTVTSVADARTGSLIVSAARDVMPRIERLIAELDASPARRQRVAVYSVQNGSVTEVATVLQELFQSSTTTSRNNQNNTDALATRQTQSIQSMGQTSSQGFGGSSRSGGSSGGSE